MQESMEVQELNIFEYLGFTLYLDSFWLQISIRILVITETVDMNKNFYDLKGKVVWKFPGSTLFNERIAVCFDISPGNKMG